MLIAGIGTAVPPFSMSQAEAALAAKPYADLANGQERLYDALYRLSGVARRGAVILDQADGSIEERQSFYRDVSPTTETRMAKFEAEAKKLAIEASERAIDNAGVTPAEITHLVTVSCSGFYAPGFDIALAKTLPLRTDIARTHIGFMGCQGAINGLRVAQSYAASDPGACVLLCMTELCSLHHKYGWDLEAIVANALFADGAAAMIGLPDRGASEGHSLPRVHATGSTIVPDSEDAMSWRIGDHGFVMTLSSRIPTLIAQNLRPWLDTWLAKYDHTIASIGSWAIHPGGPRVLSAFSESVRLDSERFQVSYDVLSEYGNMSSATVMFVIQKLCQTNAPRPWVAMAFGPGLTVEVALIV